MTDKKFTDEEIIKAIGNLFKNTDGIYELTIQKSTKGVYGEKQYYCIPEGVYNLIMRQSSFIYRQKTEIERLKSELSNTRRKALLEASSKFAGHSNYHGDAILCKLICMSEGQEVGTAIPLDMSGIKAEAYKAFAEHLKEKWFDNHYDSPDVDFDEFVDNLLKEMVGEEE